MSSFARDAFFRHEAYVRTLLARRRAYRAAHVVSAYLALAALGLLAAVAGGDPRYAVYAAAAAVALSAAGAFSAVRLGGVGDALEGAMDVLAATRMLASEAGAPAAVNEELAARYETLSVRKTRGVFGKRRALF
ncbi:MAG: hypothetical protein ACFB00_01605 [Parvularculaceae bacterium]